MATSCWRTELLGGWSTDDPTVAPLVPEPEPEHDEEIVVYRKRRRRKNRPSYARWASAVKRRDRKCVACGTAEGLTAHHKIPKSERPDLAHDVDNGETRCKPCHRAAHPELPDKLFL